MLLEFLFDKPAPMSLELIFLSAMLMLSLLLIALLSYWAAVLWAWVDDTLTKDMKPANPIFPLVLALWGYKLNPGATNYRLHYRFVKDKNGEIIKTDGDVHFMWTVLIIALAPTAIYLVIKLYPLFLFVLTLYLLSHLARFARRTKKVLDKHIADPEAHKPNATSGD